MMCSCTGIELSNICLAYREADDNRCAFSRNTAGLNSAMMMLDNTAADGQADARAWIFILSVKPLERSKNSIDEFFIETDTVINDLHLKPTRIGSVFFRQDDTGKNTDHGSSLRRDKLDGIPHQILQQLTHLRGIRFDGGQGVRINLRTSGFDGDIKIFENVLENLL